MIGPFTYTNANVQAALADPDGQAVDEARHASSDGRAETPAARRARARAGARLPRRRRRCPNTRRARANGTTHFTGRRRPDPPRRAACPAAILTAVRNDYAAKPFPATFWLDDQGRIRRVLVDYTTPQGSKITVDTSYSEFGVGIDVHLPAPGDIADITPK